MNHRNRPAKVIVATLAALFGLGLIGVPTARAGCPPDCRIESEPLLVEPPAPSCVELEVRISDECGCDMRLEVVNQCETALTAKDFAFSYCSDPSDGAQGCTTIEPGEMGSVYEPLETRGQKEFNYTLESAEGEHRMTVRANVLEIIEQGCATSTRPAQPSSTALAAGLGAAALLLLRRRKR